jgi:predicted amidohydrolase YtcJ
MNYIFTNARILTMEQPGFHNGDSLLTAGGVIRHIGTRQECLALVGKDTETIDLDGRILLPAFTDTHTHFTEYAKHYLQIDLSGCDTIASIRKTLEVYRQNHPAPPAWILGDGWDRNRIDAPEYIHRKLLDEYFPHTPVALFSKDYHSRWCNSPALKALGIDARSQDPPGGLIARDASGEPSGILSETASELLDRVIVPLSDEETYDCLLRSARDIHKLGLTRIHSMETAFGAKVLENFARETHLLRFIRHFYQDELETMIAQDKTSGQGDCWYRLGGLKLFADGSLGSQTAAIFGEYPDSGGNRGILRLDEDEIFALASRAEGKGLYSVVHAIGDRAVHNVASAFLKLRQRGHQSTLRHRVEHLQSVTEDDISLLKQAGVYCCVQPVHIANDIPMIEKHWRQIQSEAYCFRSLYDAGITVGFGSDAPIETIDPFKGIYSAITRKNGLDPKMESWQPQQRISVWEALRAYTLSAAEVSGCDDWSGSLAPGKVADLIVLDDFTRLDDEYWLTTVPHMTMLDGEIVWRDGI